MTETETAMQRLHDALEKVPEQFHADVCNQLIHDIYVALQAFNIAAKEAS